MYNKSLEDVVKAGATTASLKAFRNALYQRRFYYKDVIQARNEGRMDVTMTKLAAGYKLMEVEEVICKVKRLMTEMVKSEAQVLTQAQA